MGKRIVSGLLLLCLAIIWNWACSEQVQTSDVLFKRLDANTTGITFANNITESDSLNYFTYAYIYMGGGVSVGDINNDGLVDLYFTGNMVPNKLYLNKGNLQFEDISEAAGVQGDNRWYTGVTMADVNADGYMDIYCSVGGLYGSRQNQLYINNGDLSFTEKAADYGLGDVGNSVQATFFDYDKDGDLDMYQANYPPTAFDAPNQFYLFKMHFPKPEETDKLYRNDNGVFTDVSETAGIKKFGLTLSATVADVNNDSWPDIYVSNDFSTPDYLWINNGDGTFSERVRETTRNTSFYGMGADIADFNNDGLLDILQVDMTAEINRRSKANMASMNPDLFWSTVNSGFHYQYMQNSLQLNNGLILDSLPDFSNISRLAGVSSTDWSWGPLFADLDNDGWKDIFISNGTRREINNRDYFIAWEEAGRPTDKLLERSQAIPSEPVDNYVFRNNHDLTFERVNKKWDIQFEGFSNGCAYADLDNDGDLDIITNNIDDKASIFENSASLQNNWLTLHFKGPDKNPMGLGTKAKVFSKGTSQVQELTLTRGFQSSVAPDVHFGLGRESQIDSVMIQWPDGTTQKMEEVDVNRKLLIPYQPDQTQSHRIESATEPLFSSVDAIIEHKHTENRFNDFIDEILLPYQTSMLGPNLAVGDLNNDGMDDLVIGGAADQPASVYMQSQQGFQLQESEWRERDRIYEDLGVHLFDAEKDGDLDLYVVSGGNEFPKGSEMYQDRLYINNGMGKFSYSQSTLPKITASGSRVRSFDFDSDGDLDLFVGGRLVPAAYPSPSRSYILENNSTDDNVQFIDVTADIAPGLLQAGMVTDAIWSDYNGDSLTDLILVGEWMPVTVLEYNGKKFENRTRDLDLFETTGWWFSIAGGDFDQDGDTDYIAGNLGLNYKYKATEEETFDVYYNDFDRSGSYDIVLSYFNSGEKFPLRGRECSSQQIPGIKKKFENYASFSVATLEDVYTKELLEASLHYQVRSFASIYLENRDGRLIPHTLPTEAQLSSINQILVDDFDEDGSLDAVVAGNLYMAEVETPRNDASIGLFLKGDGRGGFTAIKGRHSGLYVPGDVKDMARIRIRDQEYLVVAKNSESLQFVRIKKSPTRKLAALKPLQ